MLTCIANMYSVFPYGAKDHQQFKSELNQFSKSDIKDALKKERKLLQNIFFDMSTNGFLRTELLSFVDQIIRSEVNLDTDPGNKIADKIDSLYSTEISLTDEDLKNAALAESYSVYDTMPPELSQAAQKKYRSLQAKQLYDLDDQSKVLEKAMIMGVFNDVTRLNWLKNPNNLNPKQLATADGSWDYLADSFVGGHTLAVNSDAYKVSGSSPNLLAVLADGVSYSYPDSVKQELLREGVYKDQEELDRDLYENRASEVNKKNTGLFAGSLLAKALTNKISTFKYESFIDQDTPSVHMDDLTDKEDDMRIKIGTDIIGFFADLQTQGFKYDPNQSEDFFKQSQAFIKEKGREDEANALNETNLRLSITALAPLYNIQDSITKELQNKYQGVTLDISAASTLNYALEIGDKIITVNLEDSDIACYDKEGEKLSTKNAYKQNPKNLIEKIDGTHVIRHSYFSVGLNRENDVTAFGVSPNKKSSKPGLVVSVYDKTDVDSVVLASDGCLDRSKILPKQMDPDLKQSFINLISNDDSDDKTAIVLKKTS
jgi:hypothetical protein